jgi:hypothetical protein
MSLWQLTNGKKFAQLIFEGKNLMDCEFIEESSGGQYVREFVDKFNGDFNYIREEKLSSSKHAKHHQWHSELQTTNVKIIQLRTLQDIPEHIREMINLKKFKKSCNQLHKQIRQKVEEKKEENLNAENENMKR